MIVRIIPLSLTIVLFSFSCSLHNNACPDSTAINRLVTTDDGWQTSSLDSVGINREKLQTLVKRICDSTYQNIHSILIVKDGRLVFEQYFGGHTYKYNAEGCKGRFVHYNRNSLHNRSRLMCSMRGEIIRTDISKGAGPGNRLRLTGRA